MARINLTVIVPPMGISKAAFYMLGRYRVLHLIIICLMLFVSPQVWADTVCLGETVDEEIKSCREKVKNKPEDMTIRLALVDLLIDTRRHSEAASVLHNGQKFEPYNEDIIKKIAVVESLIEEKKWLDRRKSKKADTGLAKIDSRTRVNIIKCKKLRGEAALTACNDGIGKLPNDADLWVHKGDALFDLNQLSDAIGAYRKALSLAPSDHEIERKLRLVQAKRQMSVKKCLELKASDALKSCNEALLAGEEDEFSIRMKQGDLLKKMGRNKEAFAAYRSAKAVRPDKPTIRKIIASVKPATHETEKSSSNKLPTTDKKTRQISAGIESSYLNEKSTIISTKRIFNNKPIAPGITY